MKSRMISGFLAAIMALTMVPMMMFTASGVDAGENAQMYVDTGVKSDWRVVGPENAVTVIGSGGAYDGEYVAKHNNVKAAGVILEVTGLNEGDSVQFSYDGFAASIGREPGADNTAQVWSGYDKAPIGKPITQNGVYALLRQPLQWSQWDGMKYLHTLRKLVIKADVTCKIRVLGVAEVTRTDDDASKIVVSTTYMDTDKTTELGTVKTEYESGWSSLWSGPVALRMEATAQDYAREDYAEGEYNYTFSGWKEVETDASILGAYASTAVYPYFSAKKEGDVTITYFDDSGLQLGSQNTPKGEVIPAFEVPKKVSDYDYDYIFAGWATEDGTVIDEATFKPEADTALTATYTPDLRLRITMVPSVETVEAGNQFVMTLKLNRNDILVNGQNEPITGGSVNIVYDTRGFAAEDGVNGVVTVPFTDVAEDGTVGTVTFTAGQEHYAAFVFSAVGNVSSENGNKVILDRPIEVTVGGQQTGAYFQNSEPVVLNKNDGDKQPDEQTLWSGSVNVMENGEYATGITVVYKVDGVTTPINASNIVIVTDDSASDNFSSASAGEWVYYRSACVLEFEADGYYYLYINYGRNDARKFRSFKKMVIFHVSPYQTPEKNDMFFEDRVNNNENATFTILAIVANNLQPTVVFHAENGEEIGRTTYKYTDIAAGTKTGNSGDALVTIAEVAELAGVSAPTKESDIAKVTYEFDGWVDADGNPVDAVYMNCDVYPTFKTVDNRSRYTVEFVNADEAKTVLQSSEVPEDVLPEYTGETPKLPSTATKSYVFKGWDKEIVKTPVTDKQDGALIEEKIVYTATYEEVERRYDVSYYDEDGTTKLGEVLNIVYGQAANFETVPTKDADVQNTYTFEKWVAMDGSDVDLTRVEADLSVKAKYTATLNKYTVTFMSEDKSEQIATSTVDYGTAAQAPEVTKDPEPAKYTAYEFDAWVDAEGNVVDLTNITGDVTVYATFKDVLVHEFTDLNESAWYMPSVKYALQNGLMSGMNNTTFAPDATMTRAQFATVLYRMEGEPDVSEMDDPTLPDYNPDAWWADAFKWANNVGIINGSNINGVDMLDPDGTVTRLQIATMLYRYADNVFKANDGSVGIDMSEIEKLPPTSLSDFQDKNAINYSGTEARWAYNHEYITGMTKVEGEKPYFAPSDGASRAQVITILMRFLEDTDHHNPKASAED